MSATGERLGALARLHKVEELEERRALFRQGFATLAAHAAELRPAPLEGLEPSALRESVRIAFSSRLLEDLTWLSAAHATAAMYELANALPSCDEKRELGRLVLVGLNEGDAHTFVLLATQLALTSKRGLSGAGVRARLALALDLPIGSGVGVDALALALISRKDLEGEWLSNPSQGSLPSRRLAARLLERAAREVVRRVAMGDESPLQVFERASVSAAWTRLLRDREPLVWRHVASARGLLADIIPRFDEEIAAGLNASLTPTEWRRAATSLASGLSVEPERAERRCEEVLSSAIFTKDRGIAASMILGLARPMESEPQAAERLLKKLVDAGNIDAVESLLSIRDERLGDEIGERTSALALARLGEPDIVGMPGVDDGHDALRISLERSLKRIQVSATGEIGLLDLLADARASFLDQDARTAHGRSIEILAAAEVALQRFENARELTPASRREAFDALRELDAVLFETSTLIDLLMLGVRESAKDDLSKTRSRMAGTLSALVARLHDALLTREQERVTKANVPHRTLRIWRLRVLLHLVDADTTAIDERTPEGRDRKLRCVRLLLTRARDDVPSPLRRIVHATAARACEALLRDDLAELSDVFIAVVTHLHSEHDLTTFAEASMMPESENLFRAYAVLVERTQRSARVTGARMRASLEALRSLIRYLPPAAGPRVEALRGALLQLASSLDDIAGAGSLAEVVGELDEAGDASSRIQQLADGCDLLARLCNGAMRRLGYSRSDESPASGLVLRVVDLAALGVLRGQGGNYAEALEDALPTLRAELPLHIAETLALVLTQTLQLPHFAARSSSAGPVALVSRRDRGLPPWLPPSRMLGGFYVLRALGAGGVGSVFIARRAEERADESAPRFALKVPEYGGTAARTLSEDQFLELFREEAGALLAIPAHENLARLVTFDAGARPKPILVMELVDGPTLQRLIDTNGLDTTRALNTMLGIAGGLLAMHSVGVGHLDLKPANVILHDPDGAGPAHERPVLVDFGLAGRKVRPGCATANYGAPEVWGLVPKGHTPSPAATDVYAFGCLVYELLFGEELFQSETDVGVLTQHLQHDGDLAQLDILDQDDELRPLGDALRSMLRQDPRKRITIDQARKALLQLAPMLLTRTWPLAIEIDLG